MYGTPSFWNWLTETEEVYPKPGSTRPPSIRPKTPPPKTVHQQHPKFVAHPAPVIPVASPAAPSIPIAEPEQFEQLPQPQRFQQVQPIQEVQEIHEVEEVEEEQPIQHFSQPDPTLQPERITAAPERFVSSVQPTPIVVTTPPTPSNEEQMDGFTRDYQEHYFGWINDAVHPPSPDMVPELSWTDLGPNGPRMTGDEHLVIPTPVVDRRRKAKPIQQQHPTKPSFKKQQHSARPAPPVTPPVFVPKPAPVKKQIPQSPKHFVPAPTVPPRFVPTQSTPKFTQPPKFVSSTFAPIFTPSTPLPKQKLIKQKPIKQLTTQPVTKTTTTTNRPTANSDYFYDDDVYDESPIRQPDQA